MRLDKYLKVSRLIKRRTVANEACDNERVTVNGRVQRASYDVKVGRFCGIDPEDAIAGTCEKFIRRFRVMEQEAARQGRALHDMTLEEMTALWNGAKERS